MFEDPNWLPKILLGGLFFLLALVIVGIFFILGYIAQLMRNVIEGKQYPLPEWDTLGEYFSEGLMLFCVALIYSLPIIVLAMAIGIPSMILSLMHHEGMLNVGGGLFGCLGCLLFPLSLAIRFFLPAALIMVVTTRRFGAALEFGRLWDFIRDNIGNYLLAIVVYIVANFLASFGIWFLCVGFLFTAFWAALVNAHAFAQVYRFAERR
jgi:uncharacterized protein DUF4013